MLTTYARIMAERRKREAFNDRKENDMNGNERDLLAGITRRLETISDQQHALARQRNILRDAATGLRTGRSAGVVEAQLSEAGVYLGPLAITQLNELGQ
jgi:hypothetical protein